MRQPTVFASLVPPTLAAVAAFSEILPRWAVASLIGASLLIPICHGVITQIIRLRASSNAKNALRVLELELEQQPPGGSAM